MARARRRSDRSTPDVARPALAAESTAQGLRHELTVHQEELRAQTEKLISVMGSLEEARDRYIELYDFAPNGYLTLDIRGYVREINLHATALLARQRHELVGLPILRFIASRDRARFLRYLNTCRVLTSGASPELELTLETSTGTRTVHLTCRPRHEAGHGVEYFIAIVDVTERRRLEAEREEARVQHAALVRQMMSLQELERQRIARDIHDDLGQQVTGLRMKLDWLKDSVQPGSEIGVRIATVQEAAASIDKHIDYLLKDLRPPGLDDLGLVAALEQAVQDWSATFDIKAAFRSSGAGAHRLPPEAEAHVYRIVQEALSNVHKHASATQATVAVTWQSGTLVVSISDNGVGLGATTSATGRGRRGLGLVGMRERATLIGGQLDVTSTAQGTTVTLTLP